MRALFYDTETAGLDGGVCQIAIVQVDVNFNVLWQAESFINPERPISPEAMGVHHITEEMVQGAPTLAEFMAANGDPFACDDLVAAGHNVQFDNRMIKEHLPEKYHKLCTLKMARQVWPDIVNHKLQTLRYMFKLDAGDAHSAAGDVLACINLARLVAGMKQTDLLGLVKMNRQPISMSSFIGFGKYGPSGKDKKEEKGTRLKDLPSDYVRWLLGTDNLDPDLREALASR